MVLICQVYGLVENVRITLGFFANTINMIHVKLCIIALLIKLYLFVTISVTLTIFQSHSNVMFLCSYHIELKFCRIVKYVK